MNDHLAAFPNRHWPDEDLSIPAEIPDELPGEFDDDWPLELGDDVFDAFTLDDDYEPTPDPGDFWPDQDAS
jgi:hypothetical protein